MQKKKISIVTSCYNEEKNIAPLYERLRNTLAKFPQYDYEIIFADNLSTDNTRSELRKLANADINVKLIFNANNFGHIRSPENAFCAATGDAVIRLCSDLQEPPELIEEFIGKWENGFKVVVGVRSGTRSGFMMECLRKFYYKLLQSSAPEQTIISKFTGFGLYDRCFMEAYEKFNEPYPYFRGIVSEIGFMRSEVPFIQEKRSHGRSKNNFITLYDMAMTGFVNHSKLPLRLAVLCGFLAGFFSLLAAVIYFVLKLCMWETFQLGLAPMVIGMFFLSSVQLIFIGIIGEYLGAVWTQVKNRPLVIEEERINFEHKEL